MDAVTDQLQRALGSTYDVGPLLGRGGMGMVYRAIDRRLRRPVAVKVLPPMLGHAVQLRDRFVREAQTAAGLSHPNIVPIYDVGEHDELVWFVMALVEGESLRAKVEREGPQPIAVVHQVLEEVAQALAYAHARRVVHRDIKPDNILLDAASGRAMVTDFGIAKVAAGDESDLTQSGAILGTARYMAPEQALGQADMDGRADMYSLGLVGYFMLTGAHAIQDASLPAIVVMHVRGATIDLQSTGRRIPGPLVAALARCLAPTRDNRFARMEEFAEALRDLGGQPLEVQAPLRRFLREAERSLVVACLGMLAFGFVSPVVLLCAAFGVVYPLIRNLERLERGGFGWGDVRRALYLERARRVQESGEEWREHGLASTAVALLFLGLILVPLGDQPKPGLTENVLFVVGLAGLAAGYLTFNLYRESVPRANWFVSFLLLLMVVEAILLVGTLRDGWGDVGWTLIVLVGLAELAIAKRWLRTRPPPHDERTMWTIPRWLDTLGSLLFARLIVQGTRFRLQRAVAGGEAPLPDLREPRALHRRVLQARRRRARRSQPGADAAAGEIAELAGSLVRQCRSIVRRLKPLHARKARLEDAVMLARFTAAGESVEGELQRMEHEIDTLRGQFAEQVRALRGLAGAIDLAGFAGETTDLQAAIDRARGLFDQESTALEQRVD